MKNEAGMAELAYASDLKSDDLNDLVGSSPTLGIIATVAQLAEQRFCKPQVAGSSPVGGFGGQCFSPVVQLVERVAVNHYVVGSSPTRGVVENPRSLLGSVPDTYESRMARVSMNDPICTIKNTRAAYLSVITQGTQSVAQLGSALRLGRKGRWFESSHSDLRRL